VRPYFEKPFTKKGGWCGSGLGPHLKPQYSKKKKKKKKKPQTVGIVGGLGRLFVINI
jgi:hypothetical protein